MEFHSSAPGLLSCHGEKFVCSELKENGRRLTIWPTTICKSAFFGSCTHLNFGAISECMEATVTAMFIFHMHIIHMLHLHLASCTSLSRVLYVWLLQYSEYLSRSYTTVKVHVLEYPWHPTCVALVFLGSTIRTSDFGVRTSNVEVCYQYAYLRLFSTRNIKSSVPYIPWEMTISADLCKTPIEYCQLEAGPKTYVPWFDYEALQEPPAHLYCKCYRYNCTWYQVWVPGTHCDRLSAGRLKCWDVDKTKSSRTRSCSVISHPVDQVS